jgi:hypothetical protein
MWSRCVSECYVLYRNARWALVVAIVEGWLGSIFLNSGLQLPEPENVVRCSSGFRETGSVREELCSRLAREDDTNEYNEELRRRVFAVAYESTTIPAGC